MALARTHLDFLSSPLFFYQEKTNFFPTLPDPMPTFISVRQAIALDKSWSTASGCNFNIPHLYLVYLYIYYKLKMAEQDRSMSASRFGKSSNAGFSALMSKEMMHSHIKSIMPSLRGGKKQDQIKYLRIRIQDNLEAEKNLEKQLRPMLNQFCGQFYDLKIFKSKDDILNQQITEQDLFYIFVKEDLGQWGEKFARQELKESDGRKSISIVQFLKGHKYSQKIQQRQKAIEKYRRDPNQKIVYYINSDSNYIDEIQDGLINDMNTKLMNKLKREGDRVKTWALANKFKQKKTKRERLYIYIQSSIMNKVGSLYKRFRKRSSFKWTQIIPFSSFEDLLKNIKKRQDQLSEEVALAGSIAMNPVSKIFDKTQSAIKSTSVIGGQSAFGTLKSVKNIINDKMEPNLRDVDKNFIIHSYDFQEKEKIYQFVMGQKDNNWQRVIYEDKNFPEMDRLVTQIQENEKQGENDQYMKMLNARTLNIMTYGSDVETERIYSGTENTLANRYLLGYNNDQELMVLLNQYARNDDDFTIVIVKQANSSEDDLVTNFIHKNQLGDDNILVLYKKNNDLNESLSMNSKLSINDERDLDKYLTAVMEDRDRNFNPMDCYADKYVYILYRYDKEYLIDEQMRKKIGDSARLKKAPYQDGNYLQGFLKSIERSGDYAIILTEDNTLREAQEVAKKFNKSSIMNVTDRKGVKDEIKVLAWGPYQCIKDNIFAIKEKDKVTQRRKYAKVANQMSRQNPIPRKMPKYIPFRKGNNVTVKLSSLETNPNSEIMEGNLNQYFEEQIRIENYQKPNEIRLVNKIEEPLTFIICRDNEEELNYMKSIAKQERDDLRQEYIIYSEKPTVHMNALFNNPDYQRFRFISNDWEKIEEYIIQSYQAIGGKVTLQNNTIYEDEIIHVFYAPEDGHLRKLFDQKYSQSPIYRNVRFHEIGNLEQAALEQSPHHLYYVLVDQMNGRMASGPALNEIQRVEKVLERRGVAPKAMKMLIINKNLGPRSKYVQGAFQGPNEALNYIANTKVQKANVEILKPHILIDKGSNDWYYFLNKNQDKNRYNFHFIDSHEQALKMIQNIQISEVGAQFWYLTNNQKDMANFLQLSNNVQSGRNIFGVYHGQMPTGIPPNKIIFADQSREQIEAFLLNVHKRSQTIFSPQMLRKKSPILAMSKLNKERIPIDPLQIKKWKEDLKAEEFYFDNLADLRNLPADRNIFLITDSTEDKNLKDNWPNLWRIVYDTNEKSRRKAHSLIYLYPKPKEAYYGFYPAEIRNYLRNLRYNMKNSPQKLRGMYTSEMTNVYVQKDLNLTSKQLERLLKHNASITNVWTFNSGTEELKNAVNHALSFPNYNNVFILSSSSEKLLNQIPNGNRMKYIVYDENFRSVNGKIQTNSRLLTDESQEYVAYLFNMPQNRYQKAQEYKGNGPLKLMYLNNGKFDQELIWLKQISKRNPNFVLVPFDSIYDLPQIKEKVVVLADKNTYDELMDQLKKLDNITYFLLTNDRNRNLIANPSKSEYFVTRDSSELSGFFNNLRKSVGAAGPIPFPALPKEPYISKNRENLRLSQKIFFKSSLKLEDLKIQPPLKDDSCNRIDIITDPIILKFNQTNLVDVPRNGIFTLPSHFRNDIPLAPLQLQQIMKYVKPCPCPQPPTPIPVIPKCNSKFLTLNLDYPPSVMEDKFNGRPDQIESLPQRFPKPPPKTVEKKLAIVYPDNREFKEIIRVLQSNLYPQSFSCIDVSPYNSDYNFQNLARNQSRFMGYDRTILFLTPKMVKYTDQLRAIQSRMKGKLQFYIFNDNFHQSYDSFKQFLSPYIINNQSIPYLNREDPRFWLRTCNYNVMVPSKSKKKFSPMQRENISVMPYKHDYDIQNQLHQNQQFVIIVCEKKDYNQLKKFPRRSPRCIIVIDESREPLKEDEVPLMRYPKRVLYYGPDAFNYLSKIRIPNKIVPFPSEPMKVLFYNQDNPNEEIYAQSQEFEQYEKVPYQKAEDLFIKLIQKFKCSNNFKVPQSLVAKDLIKLHPKIYLQKKTFYMKKYLDEFKTVSPIQEKEIKRSFDSLIKPQQFTHLPIQEYESLKELRHNLERDESPCLVFLDKYNPQSEAIVNDLKRRHLFIFICDLFDIWIDRQGYLVPSNELSKPQLATKQTLFTQMFNNQVFNSYNDMGYFYLSNAYKEVKKEVRKITFMTKQELLRQFKKHPNLLMVIFVQHTDRKHIPDKFYDPIRDESKEPRVKLIFIHTVYVHNENILYIKFDQIDPVIYHINRVELASRLNYCLYPSNNAGQVLWHRFAEKHKGYIPIQYTNMGDIDGIALDIKGKFKQVYVICQPEEKGFIEKVFAQYSIKEKLQTGERVFFYEFSKSDNKSFMTPFNNLKTVINNLENIDETEEKFETAGHQIDIKANSTNAYYNSGIQPNMSPASLEQIVESKNFVINLSENLKDSFPVGNLYTNGVKHFKNLKSVDTNSPLNQLIVTNENLNQVKNWVSNNPKLFLVYVSNQVPPTREGNSIIIKEDEVQKFINRLEGIQRSGSKAQIGTKNSLTVPINSSQNVNLTPISHNLNIPVGNSNWNASGKGTSNEIQNQVNLENFKVVKLFYDEGLDKEVKKQILLAALKNKNFRPFKFKDLETLKKLIKEQGSLSLLMISNEPPNLIQELEKENFTIVKNKKGRKLIVPKHFNSGIDGLSTILQQEQSQFQNLNKADLNQYVDTYLTMMENSPEKGRKNLLFSQQQKVRANLPEEEIPLNELEQQDLDKLNVHSNIEGNNEIAKSQWIKQRLDGGVIVMFVHEKRLGTFSSLIDKHNVLLQGYKHLINLNQNIREKKDKFTIVVVEPNMLEEIKNIKEQHPKTVFVLFNGDRIDVPAQDKANISFEVHTIEELQPIMADIFEQNDKIKYAMHGKIQSKMDTKKVSYVDAGNSFRFSTSYQNSRVKNAFVFYKEDLNKNIIKKVEYLNHITFVPYKDLADAQKKFNTYTGHSSVLISNGKEVPQLDDYISKKKDQTYVIRLNPPDDYRENPKARKNLLLTAYSDEEVVNFLTDKLSEHATIDRSQQKPKQGKNYAPRYQPNGFGTTPRFVDQKDYVPYKNDPIYSTRGIKTISRDSKMQRADGSNRELNPK